MTRYRYRSALLLFGVLYLTGCGGPYKSKFYSWQSVPNPAQFIEENQPERVRVTTDEVTELEVFAPSVEGDALVAFRDFLIPFADIHLLEIRAFNGWSVVPLVAAVAAGLWVLLDDSFRYGSF